MITFKFNEIKTTQAAAFLLKKNNSKMNYMKLIKLLYLADREALSLWERPLTGDSYFSMDNGPVLSKTLDKISAGKKPLFESYWHKYISGPAHYSVILKHDPGVDELSKREKELLLKIFKKYEKYDQWEMVDICHKNLPEWEDPRGTSIPIRIEDILKAVKKTEREIAIIEDEVSSLEYVRAIVSR